MNTTVDMLMPPSISLPRLYTVREAMNYLRIKKSKLYQLMQEGLVPYVEIGQGGHRRITEPALLAFVNGVTL